jgi:hypothetical protein
VRRGSVLPQQSVVAAAEYSFKKLGDHAIYACFAPLSPHQDTLNMLLFSPLPQRRNIETKRG